MPLPTLDQLVNFYRDHALPKETDPQQREIFEPYKDATIEKDVRPCGDDDTLQWKVVQYAGKDDNVLFLEPSKIQDASAFADMDDAHYRRLMAGTGGLAYKPDGKDGKPSPLRKAALDLCRRDAKSSSAPAASASASYELYATDRIVPVLTDRDILANNPGVPALREIPFRFRETEILAIVRGLGLNGSHYAVDDYDKSRLLVFPDLGQIEAIEAFIKSPSFAVDEPRRQDMLAAFERAVMVERRSEAKADEQLKLARETPVRLEEQMTSQFRWTAALTIYTVLLGSGKADPIHKPIGYALRLLFNLGRYPLEKWVQGAERTGLNTWWQDLAAEFRYRGLTAVLRVGDNLTEMARRDVISLAKDESTKEVAEKIERRINAPYRAGSAIIIAPPGWGKEVLMQNLAVRAVKGFLTPARQRSMAMADTLKKMARKAGMETVFIQTSANGIMSGTKYRGELEERLTNIPKEIEGALARGIRVVLCIDEFHEILTAGRSSEQAVSLLENWKGHLAKGTLRIVGFSTPDEMLKAYYEAGLYDSPASRAPLNPYHQDLLDRWDKDPAAYKIVRDPNRRPLLNRFLRIYANPRPLEEMRDVILKNALKQYGDDVTAERGVLDLVTRLAESPMAGEGYIPRDALGILDGVVNLLSETTEIGQPLRITLAAVQDYIRSDYPDKAARMDAFVRAGAAAPAIPATNAPPAPELFTEDTFYEMIQSRYQEGGQTIGERLARKLAELSYARWKREGGKTVAIDGHLIPEERIIERVLQDAYRSSANDPFYSGFRAAYESDRGRLGEDRTIVSMSEPFRELSKRAFETSVPK